MSIFRRRIIQRLQDAAQGGIELPSYDGATYPYTALLKGEFLSWVTEQIGITSGYAFCLCNKQIGTFKYNAYYGYLWGSSTGAHGIVYASSDGITWQSIYEGDNYVRTALATIEETIFDTITKT
ncbi:MAG: hypothetical protein K5900_06015 [Butyrivibrio sp.]|nr:hypothetical protein [Butyrivibrio sp.]